MTLLLKPEPAVPIGLLGGDPLLPKGVGWPICVSCDGAMTHIGQFGVEEKLLTLFQCNNDPGMCADWEPFGGGNAAVLLSGPTVRTAGPPVPVSFPALPVGVREVPQAYEDLRDGVIGQFGGEPSWIQGPGVPSCPNCPAGPMRFVVQLESGPLDFLFGDYGSAYAFDCPSCQNAAWLWQS